MGTAFCYLKKRRKIKNIIIIKRDENYRFSLRWSQAYLESDTAASAKYNICSPWYDNSSLSVCKEYMG